MISSVINNILIVEPNKFIAHGLEFFLKQGNRYKVHIVGDVLGVEELKPIWEQQSPDVVIANPLITGAALSEEFRTRGLCKVIALLQQPLQPSFYRGYDALFTLSEDPENLLRLLKGFEEIDLDEESGQDEGKKERTLSPREKDVVVWVAKGLTNKEIADRLDLSTHTVITHRRNIAKKLQIHSPSGLTIYAIANNLVSMDEVKNL